MFKKGVPMFKDDFVLCEGIYLLNHSVGRLPASTRTHVEQCFFSAWESSLPSPWTPWLEIIDHFKQALAGLLNHEAGAFCPQTNVSGALTKMLFALPHRRGRKVIVLTENDFPSMGFVLQQAQRLGYRLKLIPATEDPQELDTWETALTADVQCVLITHAHFNSSKLIPVEAIARIARHRGIISIIDIAQSVGVVPIDLQQWRADAVVGSCVKWLCGGPGAGFLWVNPEIVGDLEPLDVGWFSHRDPLEFDIHQFQYADDASRFWGGTPSVLPYAVAGNSIDQIRRIGVDVIREHNRRLTQKIVDNIAPESLQTPPEPARRGGTLVLKFDHQKRIEDALTAAGVLFDARGMGIRLSPHIYNTEREIDTVLECFG